MKRFLVLAVVLLGLMTFGQAHATTDAEIEKEYASAKPWPPVPYQTVKLYLYNLWYDGVVPDPTVVKNGKLVDRVINPGGILLSTAQVHELLSAISQVPEHANGLIVTRGSNCRFDPHHAFVFYDQAGKPVATVAVCTICDQVLTEPERKLEYRDDFPKLRALVTQLGLPVFDNLGQVEDFRARLESGKVTVPGRASK